MGCPRSPSSLLSRAISCFALLRRARATVRGSPRGKFVFFLGTKDDIQSNWAMIELLPLLMLGLGGLAVACSSSVSLASNTTSGSQASVVHPRNVDYGRSTARDWQMYPALVELTGRSEIDAIGDLHGDPTVAEAVLTAAGLITSNPGRSPAFLWTGGSRVLVSVGDIIDKGQDALAIIELLSSLEPQAAAVGGRVIVTLGNHEAEFVADPTRAKTSQFQAELTRRGYQPAAVAAGQTTYGTWLLTRPVAALIDGWFFSHAGNTRGMSAKQIASAYEHDFSSSGKPMFDDAFLIGSDSLLEAREWWLAGAATTSVQQLDVDLDDVPAQHIVFGHDPGHVRFPDDPAGDRAKGTMVARYNGRIFMIDVGMSDAVGYSSGSLLRIMLGPPETTTQVTADGTTHSIWP